MVISNQPFPMERLGKNHPIENAKHLFKWLLCLGFQSSSFQGVTKFVKFRGVATGSHATWDGQVRKVEGDLIVELKKNPEVRPL